MFNISLEHGHFMPKYGHWSKYELRLLTLAKVCREAYYQAQTLFDLLLANAPRYYSNTYYEVYMEHNSTLGCKYSAKGLKVKSGKFLKNLQKKVSAVSYHVSS